MKHFFIFSSLFTLFLLVEVKENSACTCVGRPRGVKGIPVCNYYRSSENIFIGLAEKVEIDNQTGSMKVTFGVEKTIRGTNEKTVEVFTSSSSASCGYPFEQGERYFVYGRKQADGKYRESLCGPTVLLKDAEDDLEYVRDIEAGKLRISGSVFEDKQPTFKDRRTSEPLANIEITIKSRRNTFKTLTDQKGIYLFKEIPKDSYEIFAKLPKGYRELRRFTELGGCEGENFRVTRQGSLRGRVVDFPSSSIQNYWNRNDFQQPRVTLIPLDENKQPLRNIVYEEQWAYRDRFEYFFDFVPAGNYLVAMNPQNCPYPNNGVPPTFYPGVSVPSAAKIITVRAGEQLQLTDFRSLPLLGERWLSGVVLNADKTPAVGATVRLVDKDMNRCQNFFLQMKTDENGRFRFRGFENYEYKIDAFTEKNFRQIYTASSMILKEGSIDNIELILSRNF